MTTLKKLLLVLLLSIIALGFTISVYGAPNNPYSDSLDNNTKKSLDSIINLIKSKGLTLSTTSYNNLLTGISDRLSYLNHEIIAIKDNLVLKDGTGNANIISKQTIDCNTPDINPNNLKRDLKYRSLHDHSFLGYRVPSLAISTEKNSYTALEFNTDSQDIVSDFLRTSAPIAYGGFSASHISISECPGDFRPSLGNCYPASTGEVFTPTFSTSPNLGNKHTCHLKKNTRYFMNITHYYPDYNGNIKQNCDTDKSDNCGTLLMIGHYNGDIEAQKGLSDNFTYKDQDTLHSKELLLNSYSNNAKIENGKYISLKFNTGNKDIKREFSISSNDFLHPNGYKIEPKVLASISKKSGDFSESSCVVVLSGKPRYDTYNPTKSIGPVRFKWMTKGTDVSDIFPKGVPKTTCQLDKNTTYYLNMTHGNKGHTFSTCQSNSGICDVTIISKLGWDIIK